LWSFDLADNYARGRLNRMQRLGFSDFRRNADPLCGSHLPGQHPDYSWRKATVCVCITLCIAYILAAF
jgi:hypothetical protein